MSESPQTTSVSSVWGWRAKASGVVRRLKQLLDRGERSDIQFAVGRQKELFRAHQCILSLGSDVFDKMFHGEVPETKKIIELPDILPQAFGIMLKYLYTDVVEDLDMGNALPTLHCAKKYGIPKLLDICADYAIKNVDKNTCLTVLEAAKVLDAEKLVTRCMEIVDTHSTELLQSRGFLQLTNGTLRGIVSRDTLSASEVEVYKAAERWAVNMCRTKRLAPTAANYRLVLGEALFLVRFPLMDDGQLANGPVTAGLLLNDELNKIYLFKHAARKPAIPFSGIPRSSDASDIAFSDRRWKVLDQLDFPFDEMSRVRMGASNAFLDRQGHLHLRLCQHAGVWRGGGVRLRDALGFGRYEFHIDGMDRLPSNTGFHLYSHAERAPGVGVEFSPEDRLKSSLIRFVTRDPSCIQPWASPIASCNMVAGTYSSTTVSYHRRLGSLSFSFQHGHHRDNTTEELCNASLSATPKISQQHALPVFICLTDCMGLTPSNGKVVEIVVRSFRFYPNE